MQKTHSYLINNFSVSFFPVFMALLLIASLAIFIQISVSTVSYKLNFFEVFILYLLNTPDILLYVLPISFFIALLMSISKFSYDLEMIALYSFGFSTHDLIKVFIPLSLGFTLLLTLIGFALKPLALLQFRVIVYEKQDTASINIRASEFGQKFGDWLVFIGNSDDKKQYKDIILFKEDNLSTSFINASKGRFGQKENYFSLILDSGQFYKINKMSLEKIQFENIKINQKIKIKTIKFDNLISYWQNFIDDKGFFLFNIMLANILLPILSLYIAVSLGVYNYRLGKSYMQFNALACIMLYYVVVYSFAKQHSLLALPAMLTVWLLLSVLVYVFRIKNRF